MHERAAALFLPTRGHYQEAAGAITDEAADSNEERLATETFLFQIPESLSKVLQSVRVPSEASAYLLPDRIDHHQLAHLLRKMQRAIQPVHQRRTRLLEQVCLSPHQVLFLHSAADRSDNWVPNP